MALTKPAANTNAPSKPKQSVEEYIQSRVDDAVSRNYNSTKVWLKKTSLDEAYRLLVDAGYKYERVDEEPNSVQLNISW